MIYSPKRNLRGFTSLASTHKVTATRLARRPVRTKNSLTGFTLIEFILYIVLTTGMLVLVGKIGMSALSLEVRAQLQNELQYMGDFVIETLEREVGGSMSIDIPLKSGGESTTLSLTQNSPHGLTGVQTTGDTIMFTYGESATTTLTHPEVSVDTLTFSRMEEAEDEALLHIVLLLSADDPWNFLHKRIERTYSTTVRMPYHYE